MRQVMGGDGSDTTAAVLAWLAANKQLTLANLYLVGEPEDPQAIWMTDWESPLVWSAWGTFLPATVKRGTVTTKIGLEVDPLDVTWNPSNRPISPSIATASPLQLARLGFYDNWRLRVWRVFMPTPGDANTFGACELFGGRIADTKVQRGQVAWTVNSFLDCLSEQLPPNLIEVTNTLASYTGATPQPGDATCPVFQCFAGSTTTDIYADCLSPTPDRIYGEGKFVGGYAVFLPGPNATLAGVWSGIANNASFSDGQGNKHSSIQLFSPLPWVPTPGADTFVVSGTAPINQADGDYYGFPYVPAPQSAV